MDRNIFVDCDGQFMHASKDPTLKAIGGQAAEESFDHVEPGGRRRGEMHVEARMFFELRAHYRMLVGGVVVADQMQLLFFGCQADDLLEEREPFGVPVLIGRSICLGRAAPQGETRRSSRIRTVRQSVGETPEWHAGGPLRNHP